MNIIDNEFNEHKIWMHYDKLLRLSKGELAPPVTLELDISSKCNHKCRWCVDPKGSHDGLFIDTIMAKKILGEAKTLGIRGVVFKGGGEPALNPQFDEILRITKEYEFEIGVVTNGTNLEKLTMPYLNYCDYIRISVDSASPEERESTHGVNDFGILCFSIKNLMSNRKGNSPVVGLSFCLEFSGKDNAEKYADLGEHLHTDYILIRPVFGEEVGYIPTHSVEEAELLRIHLNEVASKHYGNCICFAGNWKGDREYNSSPEIVQSVLPRRDTYSRKMEFNGREHITQRCLAAPLLMVITAGLDIYFCCCTRGRKEFLAGNINESNGSLIEFWKSGCYYNTLSKLRRVECLKYCTHPLQKYNSVIDYLSIEDKRHTQFI